MKIKLILFLTLFSSLCSYSLSAECDLNNFCKCVDACFNPTDPDPLACLIGCRGKSCTKSDENKCKEWLNIELGATW